MPNNTKITFWEHYCDRQHDVVGFPKGIECDWCGKREEDRKQISSEDDGKTYPFREDVPADLWGKPIVNKTIGEKIYGYHPQELLINKILPIDVFYKLFGEPHGR